MTREEILRMPDIYFKALNTLDASSIPMDDVAYRIENGHKPSKGLPYSPRRAAF